MNRKALVTSVEVFVVLMAIFLFMWTRIDFSNINVAGALFAAVSLSIALIVMIVYQSFRVSESAHSIAEDMTKDMLLYSHELFSELYRESPVPYILIGTNGSVTSTNAATLRLFDIREGELKGKNIFDYIEGDDVHHVSTFHEKFKQGLFINDEEVRIVRFDSSTRWVLLSLFSFKDPKGARNGLLTLVDITKQKEIDKVKSEFVSLASHQLRTPISSMKWNLELVTMKDQGGLSESQKEYIEKIESSLVQMNNLIGDFLNVSKLELGTLIADLTTIDPTQFIDEVLAEHMGNAERAGTTLSKEYNHDVTALKTDAHLLRMIVGNLVSNAIKYSPDNGKVLIRTTSVDEQFVVIIADNGMGIPKDEQDKLFTKIFRASNARTRVPDGTGLGLYIVREAARVLGGDVTFISEENVGTTFTVVLPYA